MVGLIHFEEALIKEPLTSAKYPCFSIGQTRIVGITIHIKVFDGFCMGDSILDDVPCHQAARFFGVNTDDFLGSIFIFFEGWGDGMGLQ